MIWWQVGGHASGLLRVSFAGNACLVDHIRGTTENGPAFVCLHSALVQAGTLLWLSVCQDERQISIQLEFVEFQFICRSAGLFRLISSVILQTFHAIALVRFSGFQLYQAGRQAD